MVNVASPESRIDISTVLTAFAFLPHTDSSNEVLKGISSGAEIHVPVRADVLAPDRLGISSIVKAT